ncbi:UPF0496 protein [Cocos nucifera]|uniref:UPF0496 protein n=1 Tax=Cocos nucifera TaxID=13894 RepID=A0A8K0IY37_COCNU|nr:UPF0496 protein [Cocos nucifera]
MLKEAISKNPGLLSFLNDHINCAIITTLRTVTGVKGHLDKAQVISSTIRGALECFEKEKKNKKKKKSTLDNLKTSRAVGNPFVGLNTEELRSACERLLSLQALLRQRNDDLERRLGSAKKWRKVWNMIYKAGGVVVLACSVMLSAVASAVAGAGATAFATAMTSVGTCINSFWDEWEGWLQGEKDVVAAMQRKGRLAVGELENITSIVEKLKIDIDVVLKGVDFAISREEMEVKVGMENIMAKKGEVEKGLDSLKEKLESFGGKIGIATTELLEIIMKDT